ncbi:MAG: DKNYY domain-containing protein [Bacteriovoracaceae bacterium]
MKITSGNQFTVDLTSLNFNTTYIANILEKSSGATSNSFQIRRTDGTDTITNKGPLAIAAISQYFCIERGGGILTEGEAKTLIANGASKLHYYFTTTNEPPALAATSDNFIFCHDIERWKNVVDSPSYPRLGLTENFFYMWGVNDSRFFDLNANSKLDINEEIKSILKKKYSIDSDINIFFELPWSNFPGNSTSSSSSSSSGSNTVKSRLGYIMQPWVDANNNAYCLTQQHYNSDSPLFKILKDYVGVDTEGLYVAAKEPETIKDPTTGKVKQVREDYMLINESRVKKLWFYFENNQAVEPDQATVKSQTLHFYWPPNDTNSPYMKTGSQKLYTIRSLAEINNADLSGYRTSVSASDKRIACIPKQDNQ